MANQPKKYKKFVATAATATLVASAIVPVASAATPSFPDIAGTGYDEAINAIADLGIVKGYEDGTFKPLNTVNRAGVVKFLGKYLVAEGKTLPTYEEATANGFPFTDLDASSDKELVQYAALVKAEEVFNGYQDGSLKPSVEIPRYQMALVLVNAIEAIYGVNVAEEAKKANFVSKITDIEGISNADAIVGLEYAGLTIVEKFDPTRTLNRGQFANFLSRTIEFAADLEVKVASVNAITTKKLELKLNKKLSSLDGLTFDVSRGGTKVILTPTLSEDGKSVILTSAVNLFAGDYTVTVTGADFKEGTNSATTKVEAEKETTLEILTDSAFISDSSEIEFSVKNQYGEEMNVTSSSTGLVATAYDKTAVNDGTGTGLLTLSPVSGKAKFTANFTSAGTVVNNDKVLFTVTYKGLTATKEITATSSPAISSLQLGTPAPLAGKTRITVGETIELPYSSVDQYGKSIKLGSHTGSGTDDVENVGDWVFTSSNPTVVDIDSISINSDGKFTFVAAGAGKTKITAVNKKTAAVTSTDVEVFGAATASTITLTAPNQLVVANEDVKIAYSAFDQFGAAITPANLNTGDVTLASSNTSVATVEWDGKEIVLSGASAGTTEITATVDGKIVARFSVDVQATAVPTTISGVNLVSKFENTATATLKFEDIQVKDQYGRDYDLVDGDVVSVTHKDTTNDNVTTTLSDAGGDSSEFDNTSDEIVFTGTSSTNNEVVTFTLENGKTFDYTVASIASTDVKSYEVVNPGVIYGNTAHDEDSDYAVTLDIVGKTSAGDKVALVPGKVTSYTTSTPTVAGIVGDTLYGLKAGTTTISAFAGATKLASLDVTVSEAAPVATKVAFEDTTKAITTASGTIANTLTVKDQYDVAITAVGTYSSSNTAVATVAPNGTVTAVANGTATISFVTINGLVATYTVTVSGQ